MSKKKTIKAWAAVGSHGLPFYCEFSHLGELVGRYEIYSSAQKALESGPFAREITIELGPMVKKP